MKHDTDLHDQITGKEELREILGSVRNGELDGEQRTRLREIFSRIDATTLGMVEQELINEGVPREDIRGHLCDVHLSAMRDQLDQKKIEVDAPHPIHTMMEEHREIIGFLERLEEIAAVAAVAESYAEFQTYEEELAELAESLLETEKHHRREEKALFPFLRAHGIQEPPAIMVMDHEEFWPLKEELHAVINDLPESFEEFKTALTRISGRLTAGLRDHIFKEDTIIYQIGLNDLSEAEWDAIKRLCDDIGYCSFSPEQR